MISPRFSPNFKDANVSLSLKWLTLKELRFTVIHSQSAGRTRECLARSSDVVNLKCFFSSCLKRFTYPLNG